MTTKASTNGTVVLFKQAKLTKGAIAFVEVDEAGNQIETDEAGKKIGSLYLRKSGFAGEPQRIRVTVEVL